MAWDLSLHYLAGLAAGALIIATGLFVLVARPQSTLHRLFFVLALLDGMSTALFQLGYMSSDAGVAAYFHGVYWYFWVAFITLLTVFAVRFPIPMLRRGPTTTLVVGIGLTGVVVLLVYAVRHELFWDATARQPGGFFVQAPGGNLVNTVFVGVIALLVGRLSYDVLREPSESHRRQAAYVLGGMAVAYLPYPVTLTVQALAQTPVAAFFVARPDRLLAYWTFLAVCVALIVSGVLIYRDRRAQIARDRKFVLSAYAGVLVIALIALAVPTVYVGRVLRTTALLAYPILLGFAIARYEVFDIDKKLRRAATVTLVAGALGITFILAENAVESVLQQSLLAGISSQWASGSVAALTTAVLSVPVVKSSRKMARRVIPELSTDELHVRKLEIYRHSVAGAFADGILREGESRTLAALRQSLGITDRDHQRIVAEVAA